MRDKKKAKTYTDMSFKWRDYRLQEMKDEVNEVIDKRALAWLADAIVVALIGNHKAGLSGITKGQDHIRKYVSPENFDEAHKILLEEITMALRKAALKIENL